MKKYILPLIISLFVLFGCSDSNEDEPIVNNSSSFPNIDNTQAMGVGTNLSAPTNTNVKLDSMKMYYYENTSFHPNLPGASYRNQVLTTPVVPTLFEAKHYFTYNSNGFVDKRTIVFDGFYDFDTNFKFIFDYDYNDVDRLQSVFLTIEANGETIYNENLEYVLGIEDDVLSQMQTNQFNITNYLGSTFNSPKNVFNPERNLLPSDVKLQYLPLFNLEIYNLSSEYDGLEGIVNGYFKNNLYINTHCTFLSNLKNTNEEPISLANLQYQVRSNQYPELIQFGNLGSGGLRVLYYYKY